MTLRRRTLAYFVLATTLSACGGTPMPSPMSRVAAHGVNSTGRDTPSFRAQENKSTAPDEVLVSTADGHELVDGGAQLDQFSFRNRTYHLIEAPGRVDKVIGLFRGRGLKADPNRKVHAFDLTGSLNGAGQPPSPPASDPDRPGDDPRKSPPQASPPPAPNDEFYFAQWGLHMGNLPAVWSQTRGRDEIVVAVVDTGIDPTHPDLAGKVLLGPNYTFSKKWWQLGKKDPGPIDDNTHGTHVAGIIGATADNRVGIAGVAPGVKVMAVKVLDAAGTGSKFGMMKGVAYAITHGAKVVNLSLGGTAASSIEREFFEAATDAGALVVAAAGNDGEGVEFPASYPGVLSVGAIDSGKNLASFSSHDATMGLVAPGVSIISTTLGKQFAKFSGTSMATPYVAGVAALLWSKHADWTVDQVKERLITTAEKLGSKELFGNGLVDPQKAMAD